MGFTQLFCKILYYVVDINMQTWKFMYYLALMDRFMRKKKKKTIHVKTKKKNEKKNEITLWNDYVKTIDIQNDFCVF